MTELPKSPLHQPSLHESGLRHTTGQARYVDDLAAPLVAQVLTSPKPRARITRLDTAKARRVPGVRAVLTAADIPGHNDIAPVFHDEPLLAEGEVFAVGQAIAVVIGDSYAACRAGVRAIELALEALPAVLTVRQAVAEGSFLAPVQKIVSGDVDGALAGAHLVVEGEVDTGGQDHFYLETHASLCTPGEDGSYHIASSTQHPTEVQAKVAEILGIGRHQVTVEVPRMGGGFGGKETQGAHYAAMAALGARATGRPVKVWLNRDEDMTMTGKRHPFWSRYRAGFAADGRILALDVETYADGGWSLDLSRSILDRCLFHLDNTYHLPAARLVGRVARTNTASNTAFRGFGGPQGVFVIEHVLDRAASELGLDPAELRRRNYYGGAGRDVTPYGQTVEDPRGLRIHDALIVSSRYAERRAEVAAFNAGSRWLKRGIALTPVKFGISFTATFLNQAGALVLMYADGTVQMNHGGTEMGQGLHTKMLAVCAHELGVTVDRVRVMNTATDKVPNTSATAASSGTDLNGEAVRRAAETLRQRLTPVAARLLGVAPDAEVRFEGNAASAGGRRVSLAEVAQAAYLAQVSLSATGYYRTPDIHWDGATGRGKPFHYYAWGAAVSEVEVNGLTGEHKLRAVDILHDVGHSLVPTIDRGQIEGAFIQGLGWLTCEELVWSTDGTLRTHSPDTYKIPAMGEAPPRMTVHLLERAEQPGVIHGSKAVGEPPLMLAISVVSALRETVAAFATTEDARRRAVAGLRAPCTPEAVLRGVEGL